MTIVALRLERIVAADLDRPLVSLGRVRLLRGDAALSLEVPVEKIAEATAMLARAGMRVTAKGAAVTPARGLVPGVAAHLDPIAVAGVIDTVRVRALDDGEASARLLRRSLVHRRGDDAAVRAVLTGTDRAFLWTRVVYARAQLIRRLPGVRPVVFDRRALATPREHLALVGASALTRWAA